MNFLPLEKKYLIVAVRVESPEITLLESLDEASVPPIIKTAVFRLGREEYTALGEPAVRKKLKATIEVEEPSG